MIEPIDPRQRQEVMAETRRFIALAEELLQRSFEQIAVEFDLSGNAAGMFKADQQRRWIRYNPWIFAKYYTENLRGTVPHEVAHYIVHEVYRRRRVKPHGEEWRALMNAFGADPEVTFKLDLEGVPRRRQRSHRYRCSCQEHAISSTRHNRAENGRGVYCCRNCNGKLVYDGP